MSPLQNGLGKVFAGAMTPFVLGLSESFIKRNKVYTTIN
jgi:hypothetical protein